MTTTTRTATTQVFRVFIRATPEAVWEAITSPDWTARYGYLCPSHYDLRPGGAYRALATDEMRQHGMGELAVEGEVLESDPRTTPCTARPARRSSRSRCRGSISS